MNCRFCQQEASYAPIFVKTHKFEVHYCATCSAEYVDYGNSKGVHLYSLLGDRMYRWSVEEFADGRTRSGTIWFVGEPGLPGVRPNRKMKMLKYFNSGIPTITPENVERKLRFMLLFL